MDGMGLEVTLTAHDLDTMSVLGREVRTETYSEFLSCFQTLNGTIPDEDFPVIIPMRGGAWEGAPQVKPLEDLSAAMVSEWKSAAAPDEEPPHVATILRALPPPPAIITDEDGVEVETNVKWLDASLSFECTSSLKVDNFVDDDHLESAGSSMSGAAGYNNADDGDVIARPEEGQASSYQPKGVTEPKPVPQAEPKAQLVEPKLDPAVEAKATGLPAQGDKSRHEVLPQPASGPEAVPEFAFKPGTQPESAFPKPEAVLESTGETKQEPGSAEVQAEAEATWKPDAQRAPPITLEGEAEAEVKATATAGEGAKDEAEAEPEGKEGPRAEANGGPKAEMKAGAKAEGEGESGVTVKAGLEVEADTEPPEPEQDILSDADHLLAGDVPGLTYDSAANEAATRRFLTRGRDPRDPDADIPVVGEECDEGYCEVVDEGYDDGPGRGYGEVRASQEGYLEDEGQNDESNSYCQTSVLKGYREGIESEEGDLREPGGGQPVVGEWNGSHREGPSGADGSGYVDGAGEQGQGARGGDEMSPQEGGRGDTGSGPCGGEPGASSMANGSGVADRTGAASGSGAGASASSGGQPAEVSTRILKTLATKAKTAMATCMLPYSTTIFRICASHPLKGCEDVMYCVRPLAI
eukprot:jgi/Mesvir1/15622/Mv03229-RA.2